MKNPIKFDAHERESIRRIATAVWFAIVTAGRFIKHGSLDAHTNATARRVGDDIVEILTATEKPKA